MSTTLNIRVGFESQPCHSRVRCLVKRQDFPPPIPKSLVVGTNTLHCLVLLLGVGAFPYQKIVHNVFVPNWCRQRLFIIITPLLGDRGFVADQDCRSISVSQDICPVVTSPYNNDGFVTAVLFFACWDKDIVKFNKVDCESMPNTVFDYHNGGRVT